MSDFFRKEFSIRPVLMQDPDLETVIIRRGTVDKPRVLHGFKLENEEVVGKRDGEIVGFPWTLGRPSDVIIGVGSTEIIHRFQKVKSQQIKVDIDTVNSNLGQTFLSLITTRKGVHYTKSSIIGDKLPYTINMREDGSDIVVELTNNFTVDYVSYVVILG